MNNLIRITLLIIAALLSPCAQSQEIPDDKPRPNFLFIAVDDLNHYTSFPIHQKGHFL